MATSSGRQLLELAQRLDQFGRQFERFVDDQLAGLEQAVGDAVLTPALSSDQMRRELETARHAWDQEYREQIRGLEQEREALTSAWLRVESEQRELLTQRQALRYGATTPVSRQATPDDEPASVTRASSAAPESVTAAAAATDAAIRQSVLRQFQQLRSDVRRCAQHRGR